MTTYSYTDSARVKTELRATQDFSASTIPTLTELNGMINEVSAYINDMAGRTFGSTSYSETIDYQGESLITLQNAPIITVTNVLYSTSSLGSDTYSLSDTKVEDEDYTVYKESGEIAILPKWTPHSGRKQIQINYTAGYDTTPLTIQLLATKLVTKGVIDTLLSKDINEKQSGKSVSVGSISIVKPADFGVNQYKQITNEITQLESKLLNGATAYRIGGHRY